MSESLYARLGGTEGITQIASDLVDIHLANPAIATRYANSDVAKVKHGAATFFITGTGLGASGGLNRVLVYAQNLVTPEHIDQVPYLLKMAGGDTNPLDSWIVYLTGGTIIGGSSSAGVKRSGASQVMVSPTAPSFESRQV